MLELAIRRDGPATDVGVLAIELGAKIAACLGTGNALFGRRRCWRSCSVGELRGCRGLRFSESLFLLKSSWLGGNDPRRSFHFYRLGGRRRSGGSNQVRRVSSRHRKVAQFARLTRRRRNRVRS